MPPANKVLDFEKALGELETIVSNMENGELSLEDALKSFEKGIKLTRDCQNALQRAEQKVSMLTQTDSKMLEQDFKLDADD